MAVGLHAVTRMAREDTRWFVIGVICLSVVLFLVLPIGVLIAIDNEKRLSRAETRLERRIKHLEHLEETLKKEWNEKSRPISDGSTSSSGL